MIEICSFPLKTLLEKANLQLEHNVHDLLLVQELGDKIVAHISNKSHARPEDCSLTRIRTPMFRVGTFDSLVGNAGQMDELDKCICEGEKMFIWCKSLAKDKNAAIHLVEVEWNFSKYAEEATLDRLVCTFREEMHKLEDVVLERRTELAKATQEANELRAFNTAKTFAGLSPIDKQHLHKSMLSIVHTEMIVPVAVVFPAHGTLKWDQIFASLAIPGYGTEFTLENKTASVVCTAVLAGKITEFEQICQHHHLAFKYVSPEFLQALCESADETSTLQHAEAAFEEALGVALNEIVQVRVHLQIVKNFYESVLEFGLPPLFVTMMVRAASEKELEAFHAKFLDKMIVEEFLVDKACECCVRTAIEL